MGLSGKLFKRKLGPGDWVLASVSFVAGIVSILQNVTIGSTLSIGLQDSITKTNPSYWILFLGILLLITTISFTKKK